MSRSWSFGGCLFPEIADELQRLEHALALYDDLYDVDPYVESDSRDGADEEPFETRMA